MQHAASASAQVSLPRGRHVVAVRTDPDNVYALSLRSNTKFSLLDYGDILLVSSTPLSPYSPNHL
jgi:DNA-binding beta-propeller fold protein YncE